jgi:hypothetical protein
MSRTRFLGWSRRSLTPEDAHVSDLVEELERELRQALAVEPSPDFASKVRAKIDQRPCGADRYDWRWAAVAAACILAAALAWGLAGGPRDVTQAPHPNAQARADVRLDAERTPLPPRARASVPVRTDDAGRSTTAGNQVRPQRRGAEPEVFVPSDNARALTKLLALVRSGRVDEESLTPAAAPDAPTTLEIAPIVVPTIPLPSLDIELGARQDGGRQE